MNKPILILVNTGTPDSPDVPSVRKYLREFLSDRRVIDIPYIIRAILVNMIIVPFRAPASSAKYKAVWKEEGSPLRINHDKLVSKVSRRIGDKYTVLGAMRYGKPSLKSVLADVFAMNPESVTVFPLYPHYASSTTGSVYELVMEKAKRLDALPGLRLAGQFYSDEGFINSLAGLILSYDPDSYDHVLFSYHGLPIRQINKIHPQTDSGTCSCEHEFPGHGSLCYKATCYETTRLLVKKLGLDPEKYSTSFQSRFSSNWLSPFTDVVLGRLAEGGKKRVLVVTPSFVADCLETIHEIGMEYRELFIRTGGETLDLVECLNDSDEWVDAVIRIAGCC